MIYPPYRFAMPALQRLHHTARSSPPFIWLFVNWSQITASLLLPLAAQLCAASMSMAVSTLRMHAFKAYCYTLVWRGFFFGELWIGLTSFIFGKPVPSRHQIFLLHILFIACLKSIFGECGCERYRGERLVAAVVGRAVPQLDYLAAEHVFEYHFPGIYIYIYIYIREG